MDSLKIGWSIEDELANIEKWNINFKLAKQVVRNSSSIKVSNIVKDFNFIGPVNDLSMILLVNCMLEDGFRKIVHARRASKIEENAYFNFLANGGLQ